MRIIPSSPAPAKALARRLRAALAAAGRPDPGLTAAQGIAARMLGYDDWAELLRSAGRGTPSAYDEAVPDLVEARVAYQAGRLAAAAGLPTDAALRIAGAARASAHPAGPHVDGRDPEPRGRLVDGTPMRFANGTFGTGAAGAAPPAEARAVVVGRSKLILDVGGRETVVDFGPESFPGRGPGDVVYRGSPEGLDLFRARRALYSGREWPSTRDGYLVWLSGRLQGYGNDSIEPIRSLVEDGLVELIDQPYSTPTRITPAGRARAEALAEGGVVAGLAGA